MKNENFKSNQNEFLSIEKSFPEKKEEFTINNIKAKSFSNGENPEEIENNNNDIIFNKQIPENFKNKSLSDSIKFKNLESEKSESSEPKRSLNSIELIVESGKIRNVKRDQNKVKNEDSIIQNSFFDRFHLRTLILLTVFLNIFASFYIIHNKKKIKEFGIAAGIFLAIVTLEWIGLAFAIYYSVNKNK